MSTANNSTFFDQSCQWLYRCAYQLLKVYWFLTHARTHGALVALWYRGEILLVHNSYLHCYSLPGGCVRRGETPQQAASRELAEEVGVAVEPERLVPVVNVCHHWEGKRDHVEIFQAQLRHPPNIHIDHREVIAAEFYKPQAALDLDLFPPLRDYLLVNHNPQDNPSMMLADASG